MESEPFRLDIEGWSFEVSVNDHSVEFAIIDDERPETIHYARLTHDEADKLRKWLYINVPKTFRISSK